MEDGEEEDEEDEDEEEELGAGYLLWFCLFLVGATPLLQLGLSAPRSQVSQRRDVSSGAPGIASGPFPFFPIQQPVLSPSQGKGMWDGHSPHQLFPKNSGKWLTCAVYMGTTGAMSGAEAGGARVAVLGLGASGAEAPDLTVSAIHHLHKLPTPAKGGNRTLMPWPSPACGLPL